MSPVTLGLKVDEALRARIKEVAARQGRTVHWVCKQAVLQYVENLERSPLTGVATSGTTEANKSETRAIESEVARERFLTDVQDIDKSVLPLKVMRSGQAFLDWAQNVQP